MPICNLNSFYLRHKYLNSVPLNTKSHKFVGKNYFPASVTDFYWKIIQETSAGTISTIQKPFHVKMH
jgi:hypothetical protein